MAATTETVQEQTNGTTANDGDNANAITQSQDNYAIHDAKTLQEAGELKLKDENGKEVPFKSLYEGQSGRQLIVFIRHFFCGVRSILRRPDRSITLGTDSQLALRGILPRPSLVAPTQDPRLYHTTDAVAHHRMRPA